MEDISDVSEGEVARSMAQIRASTRRNKGVRVTGDLASDDFVHEGKV